LFHWWVRTLQTIGPEPAPRNNPAPEESDSRSGGPAPRPARAQIGDSPGPSLIAGDVAPGRSCGVASVSNRFDDPIPLPSRRRAKPKT
jgi:hypothetical protein